ncbi:MAG: Holliday junction resolvase RuvX [Clostridia bacterium]|nr:Holliday junction resolvase RuvX [Clostridia bacterium]
MEKRIIALDVGDRRIGVAVSDPLGITAQPLETYTRIGYGPDTRHIAEIAGRYDTDRILCGLPRNMDGTQGFQVEKVREFAAKLEEQGLVVEYYDERMTTMLAEGALLEGNVRREDRKKKVDMIAAVMILQSYLDAKAFEAAKALAQEAEEYEEDDDDDGILEMIDQDGNSIRFYLSANIRYGDEDFVLLTSAEAAGDIEMDESFIMRCAVDEEGNSCYQSLDDEALIAAVYEAYLQQNENA